MLFDLVLALTGWNETRLAMAKIPYRTTTVTALDHAGYYPGATPITLKTTYCPDTGRIFGAQAVGTHGVDKRIDVMAMAIQGKMTLEDISLSQLTYSPPFGSARDVVNIAGLASRNEKAGLVKSVDSLSPDRQVIDVRIPADHDAEPLDPSIPYIKFDDIPDAIKAGRFDKSKKYTTLCNWGKTAYFAARNMQQAGFDVDKLNGGRVMQKARDSLKTQ